MCIKKVVSNGRKRVNQLHSVISNRDINLTARRLLLLSVIRLSIEYGAEIWEGNKGQVVALESIILGELKGFWVVRLKLVMKQLEVIWG